MRAAVLGIASLVIACGCGSHESVESEPESTLDLPVGLSTIDRSPSHQIYELLLPDCEPVDLYSSVYGTPEQLEELAPRIRAWLGDGEATADSALGTFDAEALSDLQVQSQSSDQPLRVLFAPTRRHAFVSDLPQIPVEGEERRGCPVTEFSRIGFNADSTQALVYRGSHLGALYAEGQIIFLRKDQDGWKVLAEKLLWIS